MDVYDFTQTLRRQKWLLGIGALLIVGVVVALGFDFSDGVEFRAGSRYETWIQIAVVPADTESLVGTLPDPASMAGAASLYATLLASPEAGVEIQRATGNDLTGMSVDFSGRDGLIGVTAIAQSRDASTRAALESYNWLTRRLEDPLTIAQLGFEEQAPRFDESGEYTGEVRLQASPAFGETSQGLWFTVASSNDEFSSSLADAAITPRVEYIAGLRPGGSMTLALENPFGDHLDAVAIPIPEAPSQGAPSELVVRLDSGSVILPLASAASEDDSSRTPATRAQLIDERIRAEWVAIGDDGVASAAQQPLGLLLLTQHPVPIETGTRRGPIMIMATLLVGFFALLVLAVSVDTWKLAAKRGDEAASTGGSLVTVGGDSAREVPSEKLPGTG